MALVTKAEFLTAWNAARTTAKNTESTRLKTLQDATLTAIDTVLRSDMTSGLLTSRRFAKVAEVDYEVILTALKNAGFTVTPFPDSFEVRWAPDEVIVAK